MPLRLYDSATRQIRDFEPVRPGQVGIYHCGLTVQGPPHIGHIRKEVVFDVLRRWMEHAGYEVTVVANLTDIDDKVLEKATAAGQEWWALAYANERALHAAYDALGCRPPTYEPRATGHIPEMIEMIDALITAGHAYAATDGSGDVYFDVGSWPSYGELSGQRMEDMEAAADADLRGKRDPRDFALWKGHKPEEPQTASWPTPWGRGRPGWHLECSAMAGKYLGSEFDIHGGGLDLRFPHHENELAQSRAAGHRFARVWMHNAMLNLTGEKMSKSVGNALLVSEVIQRVRPVALRYYLVAPHYRSPVEFSEGALAEAATAYARIEGFVVRAAERVGPEAGLPVVCADFEAAMNDDLGTPAAMASIHDIVRSGNAALAAGDDAQVRGMLGSVRAMLAILGLDPLAAPWADGGSAGSRIVALSGSGTLSTGGPALDVLVGALMEQRAAARARKDFASSDAIRDQLAEAGITVEDTADGARWEVRP